MHSNIKLFDVFTSAILDKLYMSFPKCVEIVTEEEVRKLIERLKEFDATSFTEKTVIFAETLFWLKSNGYINFSYPTKRPEIPANISQFNCVELTKEGLRILKSPSPKALREDTSVGDEIADKLKAGMLNEAGKIALHAILF